MTVSLARVTSVTVPEVAALIFISHIGKNYGAFLVPTEPSPVVVLASSGGLAALGVQSYG